MKNYERRPEQVRARRKVQYALKIGKLIRTACVVCGDPKSEGHHPDYSRPLEVVWLCKLHHVEADRTLAREQEEKLFNDPLIVVQSGASIARPIGGNMQARAIAEIAYSAYSTVSANKNVRGEPLPTFAELDDANQKAWIVAANAIRNPKVSDLGDQQFVEAFRRLELALHGENITPEPGQMIEIALLDRVLEILAGETKSRAA